jgi:colicin import membrane protein
MYAYATQPSQQEKVISGAVAAGMHLMFLALLVFGVNWQRHVEPTVNVVDLWPAPSVPAPKAEPAPVPPPPPPPEVKVEPKPVVEPPPPKAAPKPEVAKPDIAFKDKKKAEKKAEKEKPVVEDKQKAAKKKEEEAKKAQAAQAAEAQRAANEQAEAQRRVAEQAATAQAKLINEYKERIKAKIQQRIMLPLNIQGNPEAEFDVVLLPDGNTLGVKLKKSSGNAAYDKAVESAILKAQPLPLPPDQALFRYFRELNLAFRPQQ